MCISKGRPGSLSESTEVLAGCLWYSNVWNYKHEAQSHSGALRKLGMPKKICQGKLRALNRGSPWEKPGKATETGFPTFTSHITPLKPQRPGRKLKELMFSLWDFLFYFEITHPFSYLFPPFGNGKVYFVTLHVESMLKNSIFGKKKLLYFYQVSKPRIWLESQRRFRAYTFVVFNLHINLI